MAKYHYAVYQCEACGEREIYPVEAIPKPGVEFLPQNVIHECKRSITGYGKTYGVLKKIAYLTRDIPVEKG